MSQKDIPELDIDYIDQLLTTYIPPEEKRPEPEDPPEIATSEAPEEQPVPAEAPKKSPSAARPLLMILAVLLLLGAGFLAGHFSQPEEALPEQTTTVPPATALPGLTTPPNFGFIPNYSFMSTAELAVRACKIQELIDLSYTDTLFSPEVYERLEHDYPILTELKTRQDVIPILENISQTANGTGDFRAADLLIRYFTQYVYEQTDPDIAVDYASMSTSELVRIALQIKELSIYGSSYASVPLIPDTYNDIAARNPVLLELQLRPDAVEELTLNMMVSSDPSLSQIASALIGYFNTYLGYAPNYPVPA